MKSRSIRPALIASIGLIAISALAGSSLVSAAAAPSIETRFVDGTTIGSERASDAWWAESDATGLGSYSVTTDGPDGDSSMKLDLPTSAAKVYLYSSFPDDARPTDLDALRAGASYTYAGTNVNFQFEVVFKPVDSRYGPNPDAPRTPGNDYCDQANAWGITNVPADWCYTVIKWEPLVTSAGWTTVDLTADTAIDSTKGIGGWRTQKRIGTYPKVGAFSGSGTFSEYLAQIDELQVVSTVFGAGSGTPGPTAGWVREYSAGGTRVVFGTAPVVATSTSAAVSPASGSVSGSNVTVSGTVTPSNALGTIQLLDGGAVLAQGTPTSAGKFAVTTSKLAVGTHTLSARFIPSNPAAFSASTSTGVTFVVRAAPVDPPVAPPVTPVISVPAPAAPTTPDVPSEPEAAPTAPATEAALEVLGTTTDDLVARYSAANGGAVPPALADVLTLAASSALDAEGRFDTSQAFTASVAWSDEHGDAWVDLWAYSTPLYVGTFPVVNGVLEIDGADLSALEAGDHHLVLVGQSSGESIVTAFTAAEASSEAEPEPPVVAPAPAPSDGGMMVWAIGGGIALLLLLLAVGAVLVVRRVRA